MEHKDMIRHLIATIAYRARYAVEGAPEDFPDFKAGKGVRTPVEILHHMSDVIIMGYRAIQLTERTEVAQGSWNTEVQRFYHWLKSLDEVIQSGREPQKMTWEQLLQGPLADALTHVGQLLTLRRLAGYAINPESYVHAEIHMGDLSAPTE